MYRLRFKEPRKVKQRLVPEEMPRDWWELRSLASDSVKPTGSSSSCCLGATELEYRAGWARSRGPLLITLSVELLRLELCRDPHQCLCWKLCLWVAYAGDAVVGFRGKLSVSQLKPALSQTVSGNLCEHIHSPDGGGGGGCTNWIGKKKNLGLPPL